ncbi:hypothetical protein GCM10017708_01980 [Arthrobacter citreus]
MRLAELDQAKVVVGRAQIPHEVGHPPAGIPQREGISLPDGTPQGVGNPEAGMQALKKQLSIPWPRTVQPHIGVRGGLCQETKPRGSNEFIAEIRVSGG